MFFEKYICPYCFSKYSKSKIVHVCPDCNTVSPKGFFESSLVKCKNPKCKGTANRRLCPHCKNVLPKESIETKNFHFSIVGISNSGKTNYITVMLNELGRLTEINLALSHGNRSTLDHHNENMHQIYDLHTVPAATPAGDIIPQIWTIKNLDRRKGDIVPTYTFTIFDGAGEDYELNMGEDASTVCRYIYSSEAIILVIDPLVLPNVARLIDPKVVSNSLGGAEYQTKNVSDVITNMVTYIKNAKEIHTNKLIKIPIAVVLTKFDTIMNQPYFKTSSIIGKKSLCVRSGKVQLSEIEQVNREIKIWLQSIGEQAFINLLDSNFKEYKIFGVSSYGAPPVDSTNLPKTIKPHRVLDPLMWLFKLQGFLN
jgi:hypothetical protein